MAPIPPEVAFDRRLRQLSQYAGKQDLDRLTQPGLSSMLTTIQQAFLDALANEKTEVAEHRAHLPFHIDYIDSDTPNAHAFGDEDHSFIGLTMGLIYVLGDICVRLSRSKCDRGEETESSTSAFRRVHSLGFGTAIHSVI